MKVIQHSVFEESRVWYPLAIMLLFSSAGVEAQRARSREKIRERAEAFINEIGLESVVAITEHGSSLGPFSVVVWWRREVQDTEKVPDTETLVIRASDESETA